MNMIAPQLQDEIISHAKAVHQLLLDAKSANKAGKIKRIKQTLRDDLTPAGYVYRQRLTHFLFSPLVAFYLKPAKSWSEGSETPTMTWRDADELLNKLSAREISGNAAKQAAQELCEGMEPWCVDLFKRCLSKRPDAGMTANTLNEAIARYVPQFKCSLAEPVDFSRCEWPMIAQPKLDGVRTLAHVDLVAMKVTYYSRKGLEFTSMSHLDASALLFAGALAKRIGEEKGIFLDGEVFGSDFKQTISSTRKKDGKAADTDFHVYDFIPADDFFNGAFLMTQKVRCAHILNAHYDLSSEKNDTFRIKNVPLYTVSNELEAKNAYNRFQREGYEGAVLKDPKEFYAFRRSYAWMKMKSEASEDLKIIGYEEGTGKYQGQLGALIVDYKGVSVNVGSGLTDALRVSLWAEKDEGLIGRLIEVEYMEVTPDGSLRHPRFVAFRDLRDAPGIKI